MMPKLRLMRAAISLCAVYLILAVAIGQAAPNNAARFGYYWQSNALPYDTEFSYFFDVAVYPEGVFADCQEHYFAYITAQNKHIGYGNVTYGVEVVLAYGFNTDNSHSIKRVWLHDYDDPTRFTAPWIDSDADGVDYWELSTLEAGGYLVTEADTDGDLLKFLRVQAQTIFISESTDPVQSTWENRFYFYNFATNQWQLKVKNSFTIPASRQAVRDATYQSGSGIWAGILETEGDEGGPPDYGKPPVKKIVYRNRWVRVVDQGVTTTPNLDASNNWWIEPQAPFYNLYYRSQPVYTEFGAGSEPTNPCHTLFLPGIVQNDAVAPPANQIAFASDRDGDREVYLLNIDGTGLIQLTQNNSRDESPSWSPTGERIVFHSSRDGYNQIYVMDSNGGNQSRLVVNATIDQWPYWSPVGSKIVFSRYANHDGDGVFRSELFVVDENGANPTRLTHTTGATGAYSHGCWPSGWSPDGERIVYYCYINGNNQLWIMNADGSNQQLLLDDPYWNAIPSMSPDGQYVTFASLRDGNYEIYRMNLTDGSPVRLTNHPSEDWRPIWSADGLKILFETQRSGLTQVYWMNPDGSNQERLTDNVAYAGQAVWRP